MDLQTSAKMLLISTTISLILGKMIIPFLHKASIGQNISEYGPESHLAKQGTPTMGGIIIVLALIFSLIIFRVFSFRVFLIILSSLGFGLIGFLDDFLMLALKRAEGLNPRQKLILQFILAFVITFLIRIFMPEIFGTYRIPFTGKTYNIAVLSYFLYPFILVGTVNATNLTDGLDGLLSSVSLPVFAYLFLASLSMKDMASFTIIFIGALIGFLAYNSNKASVFMGDTGSMTIGGAVAILSILTGNAIYLVIYGFIYVAEAGSVIIQVLSVKLRNGKKVFLMTPIHHGYEKKGYNEQKIVTNFTIASLIFVLIALLV